MPRKRTRTLFELLDTPAGSGALASIRHWKNAGNMDDISSHVVVSDSTVPVAWDLIMLGLDSALGSDDEDLLEELRLVPERPGLSCWF